jgi:septin family protein
MLTVLLPFSILVIGAKNSGKSSFISFLKTALDLPPRKKAHTPSPPQTALPADSPFSSEYIETEMESERIGVTLWDSQGLEKNIVDLQLREMASFLESKFEETFTEEQKVVRAPGVRDTHIHCVFFILDPSRLDANIAASRKALSVADKFAQQRRLVGGLDDDFDLQVLRTLQGKTTVIPVISKADTITTAHMAHLKKTVWDSLKQAKLDPLEALSLSDSDFEDDDRLDERDEDDYAHSSSEAGGKQSAILNKLVDRSSSEEPRSRSPSTSPSSPPRNSPESKKQGHLRKASAMSASINSPSEEELPFLPMSIISPDIYDPGVIGRRFPWGFADPYNVDHCDFVRLKESVFSEWRAELREASRELWYEGWRTSRLNRVRDTPRRVQTSDATMKGPGSLSPPTGSNGRAVSAGGSPGRNAPVYRTAQVDAY